MKLSRHSLILRLVRERRIPHQAALRSALAGEGVDVAQATLSRDIRELGLVKQSDPAGGGFYSVPAEAPGRPDIAMVLKSWLLGMEGVGPMLVLQTRPGGAGAVAVALEQSEWPEVLGAVAGMGTVLVVTRSESARKSLERRIGL
jgi:transcriptional regulator of arginine metabolism